MANLLCKTLTKEDIASCRPINFFRLENGKRVAVCPLAKTAVKLGFNPEEISIFDTQGQTEDFFVNKYNVPRKVLMNFWSNFDDQFRFAGSRNKNLNKNPSEAFDTVIKKLKGSSCK